MTNPYREELVKLADELDSFAHDMSEDGNDATALWLEQRIAVLRRLASSDSGVTWPSDGSCVRCGAVPRTASGLCNTCLDEDAERYENAPPADAGMREEVGWLIEMSDPPVYHRVTDGHDVYWTTDASKALRFARRDDAQAYSDHIGWTSPPVRIVEHMWPALTAPGATTKSGGPAPQSQLVATDQLVGANTANGPSDPSSTRSEVTVDRTAINEVADNIVIDVIKRRSNGEPLTAVADRVSSAISALLDQFEIRRKM